MFIQRTHSPETESAHERTTVVMMVFRWLKLFRDPEVPGFLKLLALLPIAYTVMPLDALPDLVPFIGWTDDAFILLAGVAWSLKAAERAKARRARLPVRT